MIIIKCQYNLEYQRLEKHVSIHTEFINKDYF